MAKQRSYRKKRERKRRAPKSKLVKRSSQQAPGYIQELVKQRLKLIELFQESVWKKDFEQFCLRALTSPNPEDRKRILHRLPNKMKKTVLKIMAKDQDKNVKKTARKLLKELGD
jgi:hypothetical protein